MRNLLTIGLILGAAGILLFLVGTLLPAEWTVERSVLVAAPPSHVYPLIADFKNGWSLWNPWQEPSMKIAYSGPSEGVGAVQTWEGGDTNGGRIEIVRAIPLTEVAFALKFGSFPIDGRIDLQAEGTRTRVTWKDFGRIEGLPIYRFMRFMVGRFVGTPMEKGLAKIKDLAESRYRKGSG
ncbi:MAG: SRPBCC family protein [Acidobacteriota bacterium]|nr:SRPBCC family protein [Acidobacteriota bacterium]